MSTYTKGRSIYHPTTGEMVSWSGVNWNHRWIARKCVEGFFIFYIGDLISQFYVLARFKRAVDAKRDKKRSELDEERRRLELAGPNPKKSASLAGSSSTNSSSSSSSSSSITTTSASNLKSSFWRDISADWNSVRSLRFGVYGLLIYSPMRMWWSRSMDRILPFAPRQTPSASFSTAPPSAMGSSAGSSSSYSSSSSSASSAAASANAAASSAWTAAANKKAAAFKMNKKSGSAPSSCSSSSATPGASTTSTTTTTSAGSASASKGRSGGKASTSAQQEAPRVDPLQPVGRSGLLTRQDMPVVRARLGMEYGVWVPLQINLCLFFSSLCDGRPMDVVAKFGEQFMPLYAQTVALWLPVQMLCFLLLPLYMWTPTTNAATLLWAFLLAYGNFKAQQIILHGQILPPISIN